MEKETRILFVEDDSITALTLAKQLKREGYNLTHINNGEDAVKEVLSNGKKFDLLLMDIDLGPGIDGTIAAKKIVEKVDIPVVFLTSHTSDDFIQKTEKLTSYGYVLKNSGFAVINASIKMALKLFNAKKEIERAKEEAENAKSELQKRESLYRKITDNMSDAVWTTDLNLKTTFISKSIEKIIGDPFEKYMAKPMEEKMPIESVKKIKRCIAEELVKEKDPNADKDRTRLVEIQHYNAKKELIWVSINVSFIRDEKGKPIGFQGATREISKQKQNELELIEKNNRYSAILEAIPDIMFVFDRNGNFIDYHAPLIHMLLIDPSLFIGKNVFDVLPKDIAEKTINKINTLFETDETQSYSYSLDIEGFVHYFDARMVRYGEKKVLSIVRDITEQYKAEEELKLSHQTYKGLLNSVSEAIYIQDENGVFLDVNDTVMEFYGVPKDEIIGNTPEFLSAPGYNDLNTLRKKHVKAFNGEVQMLEFWGKKADGTIFPKEVTLTSGNYFGKKVVIAVGRDITERKEAEKALKDSEERFKFSMEATNDGLWDWNVETDDSYFSPAYYTMLGYEVNEFPSKGSSWRKMIHPDDIEKALTSNKKCIEGKTDSFEVEFRMQTKRGSYKWILSRGKCVERNEQGKAVRIVGTHIDITERIKAVEAIRKSEEKYRLIFEKSPLGIFHFNKKGIITDCNKNYLNINTATKEEVIGLNILQLPDKNMVNATREVLDGKNSVFEGNYFFTASNKSIPIRILFSPVYDNKGKMEGGIGLLEDRSYHKEREELEKQVAIAKESVNFKQRFLANMSHEIRTPLTGMLGFTEMLEKTKLNKKQKSYLDVLKQSGENLREIINLILDYSKIESGQVKLKYSAFPSKDIFDNTIALFSSICQKNLELDSTVSTKLPKYIKTDRQRLDQILSNLLSNAVKFTNKGKIKLNAYVDNEQGNNSKKPNDDFVKIKVEVSDTGVGIPRESQDSLFKPFSQVEDEDVRTIEGTGLGLSICKELTQILEGEIGVNSVEGKGSTFWFTFIAEKASKDEIKTGSKKASRSKVKVKPLNVLLVDDKKINQTVVTIMLNSLGHKVTLANNGKEELKVFKTDKFDLVLMDIQMPEMDGITATKLLKQKHKSTPPIVGLSANAFEGDREKYMRMGMDEYLTKPIKSEDFNNMLVRLF